MAKKKQGVSKGMGIHVRRVIAYIVLGIITFLCLFWFVLLFINTTRSNGELTKGFTLLPGKYLIKNLKGMFAGSLSLSPWRGMLNSLIVAVGTSALCVYFSTMTAYAIHAYNFKAKNFMFTFILMVMTIPTQVSALGFVQMIDKMGLMDSYIPLIVPAIASPVTFFYMKQYMESTLSLSLVEAARIDGSGEFRTFNRIVLPLMKPAVAVQTIFSFVTSWNNYFTPALVLQSDKKKTLPILLALLRSKDWSNLDMGQVYAMIAFSIFPVIVIYIFLSKFIVQGVALGGVKE